MNKTSDIINKYLGYIKNIYKNFDEDFLLIKKACDVAQIAHEGQFRKLSGTSFVAHPMRVAVMVAEKTDDINLILAAILHDVIEDSSDKFSMEYIYKEFGYDIGFLVDSVTSNILFFHKNPHFIFKDKIDKFLYGVMQDPRCAFLKLMDRYHNNKTLGGLKTNKQIRKSFETQALYNPLKNILGFGERDFVFSDIKKLFYRYIKKNKIKTVDELRSSLYNMTFQDIDSYNFELFYYNSNNIVWKIEDKKMFERLIENNYLDNKTELISLTQNENGYFTCLFKYKKGKIYDDELKMSVSSFKY